MQSECACFHLNTSDISINTDVYNQNGSINVYRNDVIFNNISMRTIMGEINSILNYLHFCIHNLQ